MPIFEFHCAVDGNRFELLLPSLPEDERAACPSCGASSPLVWSMPVMRPDALWAGQKTNYGYTTSASWLKREMKRRNHVICGDRTDREGIEKVAERAEKARDEKLAKEMHKWSAKAFGPSGLGLGGADGAKLIKENT